MYIFPDIDLRSESRTNDTYLYQQQPCCKLDTVWTLSKLLASLVGFVFETSVGIAAPYFVEII